jgi:hypothetical protein
VTISANKTTMTLGHKVYLHGHVRPTAAGRYVRLEEQFAPGKPWKLQRQARIKADGTYTTWDKPTQNHSRLYRVVMPGTTSHARGISPTVSVSVYKWVQVTSLPAVNQHNFVAESSVNINGTTFPGSLQAFSLAPTAAAPTPPPVSVEYNVNHKCTAFRATFGLSDTSETGGQGSVDLLVDGSTAFTGSFSVGQSTFWQTTFATAPLKLHFDGQTQSVGVNASPAVGTPEVLCTQ